MPYIKKELRPEVDKLIGPFISHLETLPIEDRDGVLNYAVTRVIKKTYPLKYFHINRALGVLSAIAFEFYRKIAGPYEDKKILENGDVE